MTGKAGWAKTKRVAVSLIASVALILAGCAGSPPITYYTLSAGGEGSERAPQADAIILNSVTVPLALDSREIVLRESDTEVRLLANRWWSAPLSEEINSALSQWLAVESIDGLAVTSSVTVLAFENRVGGDSAIEALFTLYRAGAEADSLSCGWQTRSGEATNLAGSVTAQQHNLQKLSSAMVAAARSWRCPAE